MKQSIKGSDEMFDPFYDIQNLAVVDAFSKAQLVLPQYDRIAVSISGGSDSDIVIDMIEKTKQEDQVVEYVWFDTGLEYQATKDHLKFLEEKYGVTIRREKAIKPIPLCVREFGVPFISKHVSEAMERLQKVDFQWEDAPLEELEQKYPNSTWALKWWCNSNQVKNGYSTSMFNINRNKYLKEFVIQNPPTFKISNRCCLWAKKKVAKSFNKKFNADLNVIGVRKAEGGIRSAAYKTCYSGKVYGKTDSFRPIFWFTDEDKKAYENQYGICHSDCYKKYGLKRTGCVGCPLSRNVNDELEQIKAFEPKIYKACMKVFGASYEYTKKYRQFCLEMNCKEKSDPDQLTLFDLFYDFALS